MVVPTEREQAIYVEIDWLDSGLFDHPNANLSNVADWTSRLLPSTLTVQRGRDAARPLGQPMVASGSVSVHNADKLLSPEFAGSPVYQLVIPGRRYRIRMAAGGVVGYDDVVPFDADILYDGAETLPVFNGFLEEPSFDSGFGTHATTLSALGSLSRLRRGDTISSPLYQNIRTDQALNIVLDLAGWPSAERVISIGDTTLDLWWLDDADPFSACVEILASEGAPSAIYETAAGWFVFENRTYRTAAARSTTSTRVYADHASTPIPYDAPIMYDAEVLYDAGSSLMHGVLAYAPSFADVRNRATYDVVRRMPQALQKVWEYGTALTLGPGEVRVITVTLSEPCSGAVAPVGDVAGNGPDYTVSAGSLASSPTIENVNAQRLSIRFTAGGSGATVLGVTSNGPQLRAVPWPDVSRETVANSVDASASIARTKGVRTVAISGRSEINPAFAQTVCNAAVNYYSVPRPVLAVPIENIDGAHLLAQLLTEVSDRISVISSHLGMDSGADFWVEQIEHRRAPAKLTTVLTCERVSTALGGGRWDEGRWDAALWGE